jgi:hypothetical protein
VPKFKPYAARISFAMAQLPTCNVAQIGIGANRPVHLQAEIVPEPVDLVHPLMQEGHDANVPIREAAPIDKVPFVAEKLTFNTKVGGNGLGMCLVRIDAVESLKQPVDVAVGLFRTPAVARVAIDLV